MQGGVPVLFTHLKALSHCNSKVFLPNITDPLFSDQWHILNTGQSQTNLGYTFNGNLAIHNSYSDSKHLSQLLLAMILKSWTYGNKGYRALESPLPLWTMGFRECILICNVTTHLKIATMWTEI